MPEKPAHDSNPYTPALPLSSSAAECPYVSRGGLKLAHALKAFDFSPENLCCADLGCSTGGFTDCLLQAGAESVIAIDTAYGELAWKLRQDSQVTVLERTNALHAEPGEHAHKLDLVVLDLGWTPQKRALPAALRWVRPEGHIISLIKPHYELSDDEKSLLCKGVLEDAEAERVAKRTIEHLPELGVRVINQTRSPVRGGGGGKKKRGKGNVEWLVLLSPGL